MSKLTDSKRLTGSLVHAWTEPCKREIETLDALGQVTGSEHQPERFKFIVDESGVPLATVTDKYTLITTRDFVSAVDIAADELDIKVEAQSGQYANGRSYVKLILPDLGMQVPGDTSITRATIDLQNDYRGGGSLKVLAGWFRMICTNGLVVGEIASKDIKRHTGKIDLMEFVTPALCKINDRFEAERLIALELQRQKQDTELVEQIVASAAGRYEGDIRRAVRQNAHAMGDNLWALSQAVSEISTHRMQTRANGEARTGFNAAADTWATTNYNRIVAFAGVA
jgi:hypothetical protein